MIYSYMGVISFPYRKKLLVYTFDGHSRVGGGGTSFFTSPDPPPQGVPLVKFDGEFIATIKNFNQVKKFSHGINTGIVTAIEWFLFGSW